MRVSIVRPNEPSEPVDICLVVDVLRATTTAAVLCHRLGEICVLRTPADFDRLPPRTSGYALFSELAHPVSELGGWDNSPVAARDAEVNGRTPVLVTTNGTLAVFLAAAFAREVLLASFVNLSAVVDYVRERRVATVAVMPAGNITKDQYCAEDDGCAEAIAARLSLGAVDIAAVIAACREDDRIVGRRAREPNLSADIELCFDLDAVPVVPRVVVASGQPWLGVRGVTA